MKKTNWTNTSKLIITFYIAKTFRFDISLYDVYCSLAQNNQITFPRYHKESSLDGEIPMQFAVKVCPQGRKANDINDFYQTTLGRKIILTKCKFSIL